MHFAQLEYAPFMIIFIFILEIRTIRVSLASGKIWQPQPGIHYLFISSDFSALIAHKLCCGDCGEHSCGWI